MVAYLKESTFLEISNKDSDFKCFIFAVDCAIAHGTTATMRKDTNKIMCVL